MTYAFYSASPEHTTQWATRFAQHLAAGDCLLLKGEVGAGKSHFARALIRAILPTEQAHEDIPSPTFTLVQTYTATRATIWHCDLYRLSDENEVEELGIAQALDTAICLIEWPENLGHNTPARHLEVTLSQSKIAEDARIISVVPMGENWDWLAAMVPDRAGLAQDFLDHMGWGRAEQTGLAADASNRKYTRIRNGAAHAILMDAAPERGEDVRPFIDIASHLKTNGYSAPEIFAQDTEHGFLLLEDLGDDLYARVLQDRPEQEVELYRGAVDLLVDLQSKALPDDLPLYSRGIYLRESRLFPEWYAGDDTQMDAFDEAILAALDRLSPGPKVTILRDYHAENLLWLPNREGLARIGLLDFQDALVGHPAYDLVSLLEDARRDVSAETQHKMQAHFARAKGTPLQKVQADCAILGAQRNAKILGLFKRLAHQSGKTAYLTHLPRVAAHFTRNLSHPATAELRRVVARLLPGEFTP